MCEGIKRWIPMSECRHGHLYRICARNGLFGVYDEEKQWFALSRHKFNLNFIDYEDHWDTGAPHGTVKPLEDLGKYDGSMDDEFLKDYLNVFTKSYENSEKNI